MAQPFRTCGGTRRLNQRGESKGVQAVIQRLLAWGAIATAALWWTSARTWSAEPKPVANRMIPFEEFAQDFHCPVAADNCRSRQGFPERAICRSKRFFVLSSGVLYAARHGVTLLSADPCVRESVFDATTYLF